MKDQKSPLDGGDLVEQHLPFVETIARRLAATMPYSIELDDLVQDGVLGLIDAAKRFDDSRKIKFETFAERRIRGAMIDALRKDAWPRGVRRVRRKLEAAREKLRKTLGHEPSVADLALELGLGEKRLGKMIVRIRTIELTSPLSSVDHVNQSQLPSALVPSQPEQPDHVHEKEVDRALVESAIASLPLREARVIRLYYYQELPMSQIGPILGVNASRISQLHARALRRLKAALAEPTFGAGTKQVQDGLSVNNSFFPRMGSAEGCMSRFHDGAQALALGYKTHLKSVYSGVAGFGEPLWIQNRADIPDSVKFICLADIVVPGEQRRIRKLAGSLHIPVYVLNNQALEGRLVSIKSNGTPPPSKRTKILVVGMDVSLVERLPYEARGVQFLPIEKFNPGSLDDDVGLVAVISREYADVNRALRQSEVTVRALPNLVIMREVLRSALGTINDPVSEASIFGAARNVSASAVAALSDSDSIVQDTATQGDGGEISDPVEPRSAAVTGKHKYTALGLKSLRDYVDGLEDDPKYTGGEMADRYLDQARKDGYVSMTRGSLAQAFYQRRVRQEVKALPPSSRGANLITEGRSRGIAAPAASTPSEELPKMDVKVPEPPTMRRDVNAMVVEITETIQGLERRVEELQATNDKLQSQNDALRAENSALKGELSQLEPLRAAIQRSKELLAKKPK